ncbi:hypothetical protein P3339_16860 [Microbulbifer sp. MLAF003]|nr:hypothetical protein [Microbulbifer sp. MLAF003]WHI50103.1 hypothetical protein P3339_16860 [Microbulbifer sp. MLAF003]
MAIEEQNYKFFLALKLVRQLNRVQAEVVCFEQATFAFAIHFYV